MSVVDSYSLTPDELNTKAIAAFKQQFGSEPTSTAFAPGRVNVIGEHTDYNSGFVLPIALGMGTVAAGSIGRSLLPDGADHDELSIRLATTVDTVDEPFTVTLTYKHQPLLPGQWSPAVQPLTSPKWANYALGSVAYFSDDLLQRCSPNYSKVAPMSSDRSGGVAVQLNVLLASSVPLGAGLSSSAAVEVAVFYLMQALLDLTPLSVDKAALACQQVEHKFAGVPCGIMDQMISAGGRSNNALLIDCRDLSVRHVPLPSSKHAVFVIADTGVRHSLATSEYAVRRQQCQVAAKRLHVSSLREVATWPPHNLGEVNYEKDVEMRRARHVVTEDERCTLSAEAMTSACSESADEKQVIEALKKLGALMKASHASLSGDYAVSCPELDRLAAAANEVPGVYGSRMTGGGFGGSTVTLTDPSSLPDLLAALKKAGAVRTFVVTAADGARILLNSAAGPTA